jgi:hypothetical protein
MTPTRLTNAELRQALRLAANALDDLGRPPVYGDDLEAFRVWSSRYGSLRFLVERVAGGDRWALGQLAGLVAEPEEAVRDESYRRQPRPLGLPNTRGLNDRPGILGSRPGLEPGSRPLSAPYTREPEPTPRDFMGVKLDADPDDDAYEVTP